MSLDLYPTEEELELVKNWPHTDFEGLMERVESLWWMSEWGFKKTQRRYYLSTGGWSGNEDIIRALKENTMFWMMCWVQSRRGGHYVFEVRKIKGGKNENRN